MSKNVHPQVDCPATTRQRLDGTWSLLPDAENRGRAERWYAVIGAGAQPAPVPGIVQQVFPTQQGVSWYWHRFTPCGVPMPGERALLRFGAVEYLADVWLNGIAVGGHEGAETPFALDVTEALRPGENLLAVRVLKPGDIRIDGLVLGEIPHRCQHDNTQYSPGQLHNIAGIIGHVELEIVPQVRIADIFALPNPATGDIAVRVTVQNDTAQPCAGTLELSLSPAGEGPVLQQVSCAVTAAPGCSTHELQLTVAQPHRWSLDDPFLYGLTARLGAHTTAVRCGFRDFRVVDGFFHLNGRRLFLRSSHTANHFPISQLVPPTPDLLRRDLLMAKAAGFNCIRFIAGVALPEQLAYCDEIGLMVYEESYASWALQDSPHLRERYERSYDEMIGRDRNHPCITIWGLLNEIPEGPLFRCAVNYLPRLRELDPTRLVLLGSGRWDGDFSIGSVSNPGSHVWEPVWGVEGPDAPAVDTTLNWEPGGYLDRAGDAHFYPFTPMSAQYHRFLLTLGSDTKPVFLSEYGIGSLMHVVQELRAYEQAGARADLLDVTLIRGMVERLQADWERWGFDGVYPFVEDMLSDSQRHHARQRRLGFDCIRANPQLCGYNLTGLLDHVIAGEGLMTFWRQWKPDTFEAVVDGWAPLRWCLFVDPMHGYSGRSITLEAVLANDGVLAPGCYPVQFRVQGPAGIAWERTTEVCIPADNPLAVPVLREEITLDGPAGAYTFAASLLHGGAARAGRRAFTLSAPAPAPALHGSISTWGVDARVVQWLEARGVGCVPFSADSPQVILVGEPDAEDADTWQALQAHLADGATVVALSPAAFRRGEDAVYWLPLEQKGECIVFHDWLYHKDCLAKRHPIFAGLQAGGVMDWEYYDQLIPHRFFAGQATPDDVAAAAFAVGYCCPGGYAAGTLLSTHRVGRGHLVLNTLRILEHIDTHPAADRLLCNLLEYAEGGVGNAD